MLFRSRGISVIFVSHRLEDICDVCDRVVVLKGGRKIGDRTVADITREELRTMIVEGV